MSEIDDYRRLLSSHPEDKKFYECVTISHSEFSKTYYLVLDSQPLQAMLNNGDLAEFEAASIKATNAANSNDLDQNVTFTIVDIDNKLDGELDLISPGTQESPIIAYSVYLSEDLSAPIEHIEYDSKSVAQEKGIFTLKAGAPDLNADQTGEIYDLQRFTMLRSIF